MLQGGLSRVPVGGGGGASQRPPTETLVGGSIGSVQQNCLFCPPDGSARRLCLMNYPLDHPEVLLLAATHVLLGAHSAPSGHPALTTAPDWPRLLRCLSL